MPDTNEYTIRLATHPLSDTELATLEKAISGLAGVRSQDSPVPLVYAPRFKPRRAEFVGIATTEIEDGKMMQRDVDAIPVAGGFIVRVSELCTQRTLGVLGPPMSVPMPGSDGDLVQKGTCDLLGLVERSYCVFLPCKTLDEVGRVFFVGYDDLPTEE